MKLVTVILDSSSQTSSGVRNLETTHFPLYSRLGAKCGAVERRPSRDFREVRLRFAGNPLGNRCPKGDNRSSVALGDHETISFQCHLDTRRYVEDTAFQSCRSSR